MGKAATPKKRTTTAKNDVNIDMFSGFDARSHLVSSMMSLGWRMAIMIIIPIIIGLKLDQRFNSKPSYVLTGFFLAVAGCSYLIYKEYKEINAEMAEMYPSPKRRTGKRKRVV